MKTFISYLIPVLALSLAILLFPVSVHAQNASLSTNLAGYAQLGTLNCEASYAVARHWSLTAGLRYNPFTFSGGA